MIDGLVGLIFSPSPAGETIIISSSKVLSPFFFSSSQTFVLFTYKTILWHKEEAVPCSRHIEAPNILCNCILGSTPRPRENVSTARSGARLQHPIPLEIHISNGDVNLIACLLLTLLDRSGSISLIYGLHVVELLPSKQAC